MSTSYKEMSMFQATEIEDFVHMDMVLEIIFIIDE